MRRKDREVTDRAEIRAIIAACDCCRLGLCGGGRAYVVPLDFGFVEEGGRCAFYFHGAQEGRKIDLIRETGWAAFEMDTGHEWVLGERAQEATSRFQCVMGGGPVTVLETAEEKRAGLMAIMAHVTGRDQWDVGQEILERTQVFRLDAEELTCKIHP